jgi:predicted transport protein
MRRDAPRRKKWPFLEASTCAAGLQAWETLSTQSRADRFVLSSTADALAVRTNENNTSMSDIRLFRLTAGKAAELQGDASDLEKPLQTLIEANLDALLGIRFLATEYSTGKTHGGRIDSLGIDENDCPVILEYKRSVGENVINQGLFYLDWLLDHKAEFKLLVMDVLGADAAQRIDWSAPRLVCIAADFTKFDGHAVQQIDRNIELIRYRRFGADLLLLELANAVSASGRNGRSANNRGNRGGRLSESAAEVVPMIDTAVDGEDAAPRGKDRPYSESLSLLAPAQREVLDALHNYLLSLGDDVQHKELKLYAAYKRLKNFATVVLQKSRLLVYLHLDPSTLAPLPPNARDVREIGHWGTGDLEITLSSVGELDALKPLLMQAYEGRAART